MIPGLTLLEDFITPEDETLILQQVPPTPPRAAVTERNSVRRYGSQSVYRTGVLEKSIPGSLSDICVRLFKEKILGYVPHSVTVNEYQRGQLIPPHIDDRKCGPVIAVLSLLSKARMRMESPEQVSHWLVLPPRSLLLMKDEARYDWKHSVEPVEELRMSVVFRKE